MNLSREEILIVLSFDADKNSVGWFGMFWSEVTALKWKLKIWTFDFFFYSFQTMIYPEYVDVKKYLYSSFTITSVIISSELVNSL